MHGGVLRADTFRDDTATAQGLYELSNIAHGRIINPNLSDFKYLGKFPTPPEAGVNRRMTSNSIESREKLTLLGDTSPEAISIRLRAAREAAGYAQQKDFAAEAGLSATTYNSQEKRGAPSITVMKILYRQHRIDFNFVLHGDFAQLPGDVQERLFEALSSSRP